MAQFKPKSSSLKAPNVKSSSSGMAQLMALMMAQQKAQQTQSALPEGSYQTKATDAMGNVWETPDARLGTADAQNQLNRIKQIKEVVRGVQDLGNTLPTDLLKASYGTAGAKFGFGRFGTAQHKTYLDSIPTAAAGVYRAITGDNRLSDADAASRAKPLFWDPMEDSTVREGKYSFINFMMDQAEQGITPGEPKDDMDSLIRWQTFVNNSKKKFGAPGTGGSDVNTEKQKAMEAIQKGKDPAKVKALFKQRTGQEFDL